MIEFQKSPYSWGKPIEPDITIKYDISYIKYSVNILCPFCNEEFTINESHNPYKCDCGHEYCIDIETTVLLDGE